MDGGYWRYFKAVLIYVAEGLPLYLILEVLVFAALIIVNLFVTAKNPPLAKTDLERSTDNHCHHCGYRLTSFDRVCPKCHERRS